jgi:hypothetical protein
MHVSAMAFVTGANRGEYDPKQENHCAYSADGEGGFRIPIAAQGDHRKDDSRNDREDQQTGSKRFGTQPTRIR